jgi:hypothetical protein
MDDEKILVKYDLRINRYEGNQTSDELHNPCEKCLFMTPDFTTNEIKCLMYNVSVRECLRNCIGNYRLDIESLLDAMKRKMADDDKAWGDWINSYDKYMKPEDGKLYVINTPGDIIQVAKDLKNICGE